MFSHCYGEPFHQVLGNYYSCNVQIPKPLLALLRFNPYNTGYVERHCRDAKEAQMRDKTKELVQRIVDLSDGFGTLKRLQMQWESKNYVQAIIHTWDCPR
jgi:hypothetical protein